MKAASTEKNTDREETKDRSEAIRDRIKKMTPEGFMAVKVVTGASNGLSIAILSGIDENSEIYLAENNNVQEPVSAGNRTGLTGNMPGGNMGGMRGGNMGGMPMGGMPGGNMSGMRR
ncbi:MAG: hypothetical protein Q4G23_11825 [Clostridia bacterium]|nr:hypothetical protein [Clostridia bacterium]